MVAVGAASFVTASDIMLRCRGVRSIAGDAFVASNRQRRARAVSQMSQRPSETADNGRRRRCVHCRPPRLLGSASIVGGEISRSHRVAGSTWTSYRA